jgi:hypothetical protein
LKLRWKLGVGIPAAVLAVGITLWFTSADFRFWSVEAYLTVRPVPRVCKQRAAELQKRVERLKADARNSLKAGATRAEVAQFFASENIPFSVAKIGGKSFAIGTAYVAGLPECANAACGDDSALVGVRVEVSADGAVASDPDVVGMYTDCL